MRFFLVVSITLLAMVQAGNDFYLAKKDAGCKSAHQKLKRPTDKKLTVQQCADLCAAETGFGGCKYFIFGKSFSIGSCSFEMTDSVGCREGWEPDVQFDFYALGAKPYEPPPAPPRTDYGGPTSSEYKLIMPLKQCNSPDQRLAWNDPLMKVEHCAAKCARQVGCKFFTFDTLGTGTCYWEKGADKACSQGFSFSRANFYEYLGAFVPPPPPPKPGADSCNWSNPVESAIVQQDVNGGNFPEWGRHLGIDLVPASGAFVGSAVYAVADGTVVTMGNRVDSYMYPVVIQHVDPFTKRFVYSFYGHVMVLSTLRLGMQIAGGTQLGTLADVSKYGFEPHLHFGLHDQGQWENGPVCGFCNSGDTQGVPPGYWDLKLKGGALEMKEDKESPLRDPYLEVVHGPNNGFVARFYTWNFARKRIANINATPGCPLTK